MPAPKIIEYDGKSNARTWFRTTELAFATAGLQEPGWLQHPMPVQQRCAALRGDAATWRDSVWPDGTPMPWPDTETFKAAFIAAHTPVNDVELARKLLWDCVQTGPVEDYIARFRALVLRIPRMGDEDRLDRFVHNLEERIQQQVTMAAPATVEAAYSAAQHASSCIPPAHPAAAAAAGSSAPHGASCSHDDPMELNAMVAVEAALCARGVSPSGFICWYCHHTGHLSSCCPNLASVICQLCGHKGHGAGQCDRFKKRNNTHR
jgi:hypothetical protein